MGIVSNELSMKDERIKKLKRSYHKAMRRQDKTVKKALKKILRLRILDL